MTEPKIPDAREDDHDDIADKLNIAAAMWARGDRADALSWLRRAAESASDLEQDVRALELAKAASDLATFVDATHASLPAVGVAGPPPAPAAPAAAAPAAATPAAEPPPRPKSAVPPPKPSARPPMPPKPAAAPSAAPKAAKPPGSRPPGSKLPPLPPMRPLGTAPPAPAKPAQPVQRTPSMVTSVLGATSASGTVTKEEPAREASRPMPWDEQADDEPTKQIAIAPPEAAVDHEATGTHEIEQVEEAAPHAAPPHAVAPEPAALPLAVGVRVRLILDEHGRVIAEPDRGQSGVVALLVPAEADDDLRSLFQPRA